MNKPKKRKPLSMWAWAVILVDGEFLLCGDPSDQVPALFGSKEEAEKAPLAGDRVVRVSITEW